MDRGSSWAVRIASSHLITSLSTAAAIILFVALGSAVVPPALGGEHLDQNDRSLLSLFSSTSPSSCSAGAGPRT